MELERIHAIQDEAEWIMIESYDERYRAWCAAWRFDPEDMTSTLAFEDYWTEELAKAGRRLEEVGKVGGGRTPGWWRWWHQGRSV